MLTRGQAQALLVEDAHATARYGDEAFDAKLEFDIKIIPYKGDCSWIEKTIMDARECLLNDKIPEAGKNCDYCNYISAISATQKSKSKATLF